jgi:hypothetical protein
MIEIPAGFALFIIGTLMACLAFFRHQERMGKLREMIICSLRNHIDDLEAFKGRNDRK